MTYRHHAPDAEEADDVGVAEILAQEGYLLDLKLPESSVGLRWID